MKHILLLLLLVSESIAHAQLQIDPTDSTFRVSEVHAIKQSKDVAFLNTKEWVAKTFGNYSSVVQFEDKEAGKLIIKGLSKINVGDNDMIKYTLSIDIKDSKFRCVIDQFGVRFNPLGDEVNYIPLERYFGRENINTHELDSLRLVDLASLRKKDANKVKDEINVLKKVCQEYDDMRKAVSEISGNLISSLEAKLNDNNDF